MKVRRRKLVVVIAALVLQFPLALVLGQTGLLSGVVGHVPVCHDPPWRVTAAIGMQLADCPPEQASGSWGVEAEIYTQEVEGGVVYLRTGSAVEGWGREHIQDRHGWPEESNPNTGKNTLDAIRATIANPTHISRNPDGTVTLITAAFRVVVQTTNLMGIITAFTPT